MPVNSSKKKKKNGQNVMEIFSRLERLNIQIRGTFQVHTVIFNRTTAKKMKLKIMPCQFFRFSYVFSPIAKKQKQRKPR